MSILSTFSPPVINGPARQVDLITNGKVVVVGAGIFGAWAALCLLREGFEVTLTDIWGPGNSRSSSGGESRLIRSFYGENRMYFEMAKYSWIEWKKMELISSSRLLHQTGVLWMFSPDQAETFQQMVSIMDEFSHPYELLQKEALVEKFPIINATDIGFALIEKDAGYLEARNANKVIVEQFVTEGGTFIQGEAQIEESPWIVRINGKEIGADLYLFACGPWLKELFPFLDLQVTRQEVHYFGPPRSGFLVDRMIPWVDWSPGNIYYGLSGHDQRGFKIAYDTRGEEIDPTNMERIPRDDLIQNSRNFLEHRFPSLEGAPFIEGRVCQYANTHDGNFIFDQHPNEKNVWILGGGSGHGFKHGPAIGNLVTSSFLKGEVPASFLIS